VLAEMQRICRSVGEVFEKAGWRFEVVDLDGRRIDKILVEPDRLMRGAAALTAAAAAWFNRRKGFTATTP
jgi:hypothetical protein